MAKSTTQADVGSELPADAQASTVEDTPLSDTPVPASFEITLDEFMQKLSMRDGRVELINSFNFTEKAAGAIKDLESTFQARFVAFTNTVIEG